MNAASLLPTLPSGSRILVVRLRSIGDIVLLTPAFRLLKEWRSELRISVLVESRFRDLLAGNPDVEEILDPGEGVAWAKALARLRAVRNLRLRKFALCVNLHGGPTSRLLTRASGARWRVGFKHHRARGLYHFLVPDARSILDEATIHTAEHQASAFFYLGLPRTEIPRSRIFISAEAAAWWEENRPSHGLAPGQPYAIVHPAALYDTKRWAPENFARLGAYLEQAASLVPVFTSGPGESAVLDAVERAAGSPIRRLEGASLGQFAAALAGASLFVGNDSGPAHMAAALARPTVVIFGSSSSVIWGPWPRRHSGVPATVVQNHYDCNPCRGDHCYRFVRPECILSVTFDQVCSAVRAVLTQAAQFSCPESAGH
jgi:lipopolysaccharide heptosyltransferase III